jgi:3-deoxy-D-arabino-heptulosonate 7-phosphate (DAHP) synthase
MHIAPELPSTAQLHESHPLDLTATTAIADTRTRINEVLQSPESGLIVIIGACALTDQPGTLDSEAAALQELEAITPGLVTVQRLNTWKPRSRPEDWHGMESTADEVGQAHAIVTRHAATYGNTAMEVGYEAHLQRYARSLALGWIGARADEDLGLLEAIASTEDLPVAVKNGLSGDVEPTLKRLHMINEIREGVGAAAVLLYRGGENALTPQAWEGAYIEALERTNGAVVVDCAHGGMRAHTPGNGKSIDGQLRARDHVIDLAEKGYLPAGIMLEASDTPSVVDPNMPHSYGLEGALALATIKAGVTAT